MNFKLIAISGLLSLTACTYQASFRNFDFGATPPQTMKGKTVAVVVDPARIQDGHTTTTDVYQFKFNDVTAGLTEALQKRIGMTAEKVDIVKASELKAGSYQVLVYPSLKARSVHDFWTMGCYIEYGLEVRGKDGRVLANEKGTGKRNFLSARQFDDKCRIAMEEVFVKVTDRTLNLVK